MECFAFSCNSEATYSENESSIIIGKAFTVLHWHNVCRYFRELWGQHREILQHILIHHRLCTFHRSTSTQTRTQGGFDPTTLNRAYQDRAMVLHVARVRVAIYIYRRLNYTLKSSV